MGCDIFISSSHFLIVIIIIVIKMKNKEVRIASHRLLVNYPLNHVFVVPQLLDTLCLNSLHFAAILVIQKIPFNSTTLKNCQFSSMACFRSMANVILISFALLPFSPLLPISNPTQHITKVQTNPKHHQTSKTSTIIPQSRNNQNHPNYHIYKDLYQKVHLKPKLSSLAYI